MTTISEYVVIRQQQLSPKVFNDHFAARMSSEKLKTLYEITAALTTRMTNFIIENGFEPQGDTLHERSLSCLEFALLVYEAALFRDQIILQRAEREQE